MNKQGPLSTPFDNGMVPTPDAGSGTMIGPAPDFNLNESGGGKGLTGTPFDHPVVPPGSVSVADSGNTSGLPKPWSTVPNIPDAPAPGSTAAVADGVATPNTPVGNMTGGKDGENIGIGKS